VRTVEKKKLSTNDASHGQSRANRPGCSPDPPSPPHIAFAGCPWYPTLALVSSSTGGLLRKRKSKRGVGIPTHYRGTLAEPRLPLALANTGLYLEPAPLSAGRSSLVLGCAMARG